MMLRQGGLFLQFPPYKINRGKLLGLGYQTVLTLEDIPAILGTFSERNAYPLGTNLLILKKG